MPAYVEHPDKPGTIIDVMALQGENPLRVLPAFLLPGWMKRDSWSRREALMLLAGYNPNVTQWTETADGFGMFPAGNVGYLDKLSESMIRAANVSWRHPRYEEALREFWALSSYAAGGSLDERNPPSEWIAWAASKEFSPYWLSMLDSATTSPPDVSSVGASPSRTQAPYQNTRDWWALNEIVQLEKSGTRAVDITADLLLQKLALQVGNGNCLSEADPNGKWIKWKDENDGEKKWHSSAIVEWLNRRGYGPRRTGTAAKKAKGKRKTGAKKLR